MKSPLRVDQARDAETLNARSIEVHFEGLAALEDESRGQNGGGFMASSPAQPPADQGTPEELDRYYSSQLVTRLEQVVERASALDPLQLKVTSSSVKALFQAAHEVYLYGFDVACIALCRGLIDHALKDKLAVAPGERPALRALIDRAQVVV